MYSPLLRIMRLGSRFQELKDLLVLFRGEVGADTHVHHNHFPLRGTVVAGRSDVVTPHAVIRPKFRSAFPSRSSSDLSRLLICCTTKDQPRISGTKNNEHSGHADPSADL